MLHIETLLKISQIASEGIDKAPNLIIATRKKKTSQIYPNYNLSHCKQPQT